MALVTFNDNVQLNAPKHIDTRYINLFTPWGSVGAANAGIPSAYRYLGLTVLIGVTEYWYQSSTADGGLVPKIGGVTAITANNGVNMSTATNVQLGGAIIQNTLLDTTGGDFKIFINGSSNTVSPFIVTNALNAPAILGQATSGSGGVAIKGVSTTGGISVQGQATNGIAIYGTATVTGGVSLYALSTASGSIGASLNASGGAQPLFVTSDSLPSFFNIAASSTNTVIPVIQLVRQTTTNGANNIGGSIEYYLQQTASGTAFSNSIISEFPTATAGSQTSQLRFRGVNAGATVDKFIIGAAATSLVSTRFAEALGANVASANNLTLGNDGNLFHITGTTQINAITIANWQAGSRITLIFNASVLIKSNTAGGGGTAPLILAGSADFAANANDTLTLAYDGTNWYELTRKTTISGGVYTFRNGLTESPATFVGLGGSLIANTTINPNNFGLNISGSSGFSVLNVVNTQSTFAGPTINATAVGLSNIAVSGTTDIGIGIFGLSTSTGIGIFGNTTSNTGTAGSFTAFGSGVSLIITSVPIPNNSVTTFLTIVKNASTASAAAGLGGSVDMSIKNTAGNPVLANQLITKWATTPTPGAETSQFIIRGSNSGTMVDKLYFNANSTQVNATRFENAMGAVVASANNLTLGTDGNIFPISGTTQINAITTADWQAGSQIGLLFQAALTVKNNTAGGGGTAVIILRGGADYVTTPNDFLLLVYDGIVWREVTRTSVSSFGAYTFTSGVTEAPAGTVKLGGTLSQNTTIDGSTSFQLNVTAASTLTLNVSNTNAAGQAANFTITPTSTNTFTPILSLFRNTTGTGGNNIGQSIDFYNQSSTTTGRLTNRVISSWLNATDATRTSSFSIFGVNNTTTVQNLVLKGTGALQLNSYGSGTFSGTAAKTLQVDASGNVIEGTSISSITANNGLTANTSTNIQLGGTLIQNTIIPMAGFLTAFFGSGNVTVGTSFIDGTGSQFQTSSSISLQSSTAMYFNTGGGDSSGYQLRIYTAFAQTPVAVIRNSDCTFFGLNAGGSSTPSTGVVSCTGIGFNALQSVQNLALNLTAVGLNGLSNATTARQTTTLGANAAFNVTTSSGSVYIGDSAGFNMTTENFNTLIGFVAFVTQGLSHGNFGVVGGGNTAVGYNAGGSNLTFIGTTTSISNSILLGCRNGVVTEGQTLTNVTLLGNDLLTSHSNVAMVGTSSQNVQVGAPNNQADSGDRLQVYGTAKLDTLPTTINSTTNVAWDNTTHQLVQGSVGGGISANNGLSTSGSNIQLGGTLIQNTIINQGAAFQLSFTNSPVISIGDSSAQTDRVFNVTDTTSSLTYLSFFNKTAALSNTQNVITSENFLQVTGTTFTGTMVGSHTNGLDGQIWMNYSSTVALNSDPSSSYTGVYGAVIRAGAANYSGNIMSGGYFGGYAAASGNASDVAGILIRGLQSCPVTFGAAYTGTVTNYYGLYVDNVATSSLGTSCSNKFGVVIRGISASGIVNIAESAFVISSDRRIKTNIKPSSYGLSEIEKLSTTEFTYIDDIIGLGRQIGFIAQDVEAVLPEAITTREWDGISDFKFLDKNVVFSVMVNAIKELSAQNKTLTDQVNTLINKN